ncbi:MAG: N-acetylglucosamine-6-phosphate deacetylase [Planctomycetota bacterium]
MHGTVIRAAAAVVEGRLRNDVEVQVRDGRITRVDCDVRGTGTHATFDGVMLPGPIDLQVNGMGGVGFDAGDPRAFDHAARAVLAGGATSFLPTLITAPIEVLCRRAAALARWLDAGPAPDGAIPLGIHLEGPFLEVAGAHDPRAIAEPEPRAVEALIDACGGHLALMTLAPGLRGAVDAIRRLRAAGAAVAIGHAHGTDTFDAAVDAGASLVTHLFNAMSPVHHREPGVAALALDERRLTCCLICDGHHVHPSVLRIAWRVLGRARTVLVTDAIGAAGMPDGDYELSGSPVTSVGGVVRDREGRLAGSSLTMSEACARFARFVPGVDDVDLAAICSTNAARALGAVDLGGIAPGMRACFAFRRDDGSLQSVRSN